MNDSTQDRQDRQYKFDLLNSAIATVVLLFTFVIYYLTKSPTVSFWDCGEFITCAHILGVAHPPGNPLYILISRIFAWLPLAADISVRVNLVSVAFSALAAMFGYLIAVRLLRSWFVDHKAWQNRIIIYTGGITGSLFMAFSNTNWSNGVEAEVYAMSMMLMLAVYWLVLRYLDNRGSTTGQRLILGAFYVAILSVGVHLTSYVVVPVLAFYFIFKNSAGIRQWLLVAMFFIAELFLIILLSARPGELPVYLPSLIIGVLFLFHVLYLGKFHRATVITLVLFGVSILPFILYLVNVAAGRSWALPVNLPLNQIGLLMLLAWAIYSGCRYFKNRMAQDAEIWLTIGIYAVAPAAFNAIGSAFQGYHAFVYLSGVIAAGVGLLVWRQINLSALIGAVSVSMIILGFWQFVWGLAIGGVVLAVLGILLKDGNWKLGLGIIVLAAVAWSVHVYIPIRSAHNPAINLNNPSKSFAQFVNYLERKQYGHVSMTEKMFTRRGEWQNQFGTHRRMGFWGFFTEQYGLSGRKFFIPLLLGLIGIWEAIRRRPHLGLPFFVIILLCTVGLVLYMNFADGTRENKIYAMDYLEVRDRDYFFTPGFMFFGLAIGLGIAGVMDIIREALRALGRRAGDIGLAVSSLLVLMPVFPLGTNYFYNDRSRNYMAYDYSENYLKSCRPGAILITNGDNDTFPVWCLQEVYGIRRDVRVINLSLGNTPWYIEQLRDRDSVPISWSDDEIDRLRSIVTSSGTVFRIQDQLVENVIRTNRWRHPIQMTFTVPPESRRYQGRTLDSNLTLEGMAFTLVPDEKEPDINFEVTRRLFLEEFNYRGVNDSTIYQNESTVRLLDNYAQGFILLADSLKRAGDFEGCIKIMEQGINTVPLSFDLYAYLTQVFAEMGKPDTLDVFIGRARTDRKKELYFNYAVTARYFNRYEEAKGVLEQVLMTWPDYSDAYRLLMNLYYQDAQFDKLERLLTDWLKRHPEDSESRQVAKQLDQLKNIDRTAPGVTP